MVTPRAIRSLLPVALLFLAHTAAALEVTGVFPLPGERFTGRFVVFFDGPITFQPASEEEQAVHVSPDLAGDCVLGENYLSFTSQRAKLPAPRYTFRISESVKGADGTALPAPQRSPAYFTRGFTVRAVERDAARPDSLGFSIALSQRMDRAAFFENLTVMDAAGQPVAREQTPPGDHFDTYTFTVPADTALPLTIRVNKALGDTVGPGAMDRDHVTVYPAEEPLRFRSCQWYAREYERNELRLSFSLPVAASFLREYLQVTDGDTGAELPFGIPDGNASNAPRVYLGPEADTARSLHVLARAGLPGQGGHVLPEDHRVTASPQHRGSTVRYHSWGTRGVDGPLLYLSIGPAVTADSLKDHLRVEPEAGELEVVSTGYGNFTVDGDWRAGERYRLTVTAGIADSQGRVRSSEDASLTLQPAPKSIGARLGYPGRIYLPRLVPEPVPLFARNLNEVHVNLHRVLPSNLAFALDNMHADVAYHGLLQRHAVEVAKTTVPVPGGDSDAVAMVPLDLGALLPEGGRGVYVAEVREELKVLLWTRLGVLAHWQDDGLLVYVHDLLTLAPKPGMQVTIYSTKNQVLGTVTTDGEGVARLHALDSTLGAPSLAVVEGQGDYTFLELDARATDDVSVANTMPPYLTRGYEAYLYLDRNLYRPGETVHARWIVRDAQGAAAPEMPVTYRLTNPKNQEAASGSMPLSAFGTGGIDLPTRDADLTGMYNLRLSLPGSNEALGTAGFNVEEFVPNRITVVVDTPRPALRVGERAPITVAAMNLSGPPAADRTCKASVVLRKAPYVSDQWPGYHFGNEDDFNTQVLALGEAKTDGEGKASFTFEPKALPGATAPLAASLRAEVSELGGRAVVGRAERTLFPAEVMLGLAASASTEPRELKVAVAAIGTDEAPAPLPAVKVALERRVWRYHLRRMQHGNEPGWTTYFEPVEVRDVPLAQGVGETSFNLARHYGYVRVRVFSEATPMTASRTFHAGWRRIDLAEEARPQLVKLALDKSAYAPGDDVRLRIESPFDGEALVVLEGAEFHDTLRVPIQEGEGHAVFPVTRAHCPNVWAEVTAVNRPGAGENESHPYSSFAIINVPVRDPRRTLGVEIARLPKEVRPGNTVNVRVQVRDAEGDGAPAELTLAAVDEGIHQILNYADPDPAGWLGRARRPMLRRAHYYDRVAYGFEAARIGGGAMLRARLGEDNPGVTDNWIKPVALWSGTVQTDAAGMAEIPLALPEFNGRLRLVAVAADAGATGAAREDLLVRRPYMLRTSMPRFALPGDRFTCPVVAFNVTDQPRQGRLTWSAEGAVRSQDGSLTLALPAQGQATAAAEFQALETLGQGLIRWRLDVLDTAGSVVETVREDAPLPVLAPAAYRSEGVSLVLDPGASRVLTNTWFHEAPGVTGKVLVSADPMLRLRGALDHVVGYPHGCVEQTTSRSMPMLLLGQHAGLVKDALRDEAEVKTYLQAGVDRLVGMQVPDGGLAFWPGGMEAYPYGTVYAGHFLTLARKAPGLEVPDSAFRKLQGYLRRMLADDHLASMDGLYRRAYALYVLALDGDLKALEAIPRFDGVLMPVSGRYLLAAALAMNTKDPARVQAYLDSMPAEDFTDRRTSGSLNSPVRNQAVKLMALVQCGVRSEEQHQLARDLMDYLSDGDRSRWRTTHESGFVSTALGQYLESLGLDDSGAQGVLVSNGKTQTVGGVDTVTADHAGPGMRFEVSNTGARPLFVDFTASGIPRNPANAAETHGIAVARRYHGVENPEGASLTFTHGETYLVDLKLTTSSTRDHVVAVDILPAGLEVENPRLDADALAGRDLPGSVTPSHLEVRDDRVVIAFEKLGSGEHHFYYLVRAVTPGEFEHPAAAAECMYDPVVRGKTANGRVTVDRL